MTCGWLGYVKQKEEGKGLENFHGSHGYMRQEKQENPNTKGLALLINKHFTDYVERIEKHSDRIISCKIKLHGKHYYKSYKSMPLHATKTMKQWSCFMKNLRKLWTRKPVATTR